MADFRTSQTFAGVFADWDPALRVSKLYVEVVADQNPTLRVSKHYVEVVADFDPFVRVTQYHLEVLYSVGGIELSGTMEEQEPDVFPKYYPVPYGERWGHTT
jgi:hypothetical protein